MTNFINLLYDKYKSGYTKKKNIAKKRELFALFFLKIYYIEVNYIRSKASNILLDSRAMIDESLSLNRTI